MQLHLKHFLHIQSQKEDIELLLIILYQVVILILASEILDYLVLQILMMVELEQPQVIAVLLTQVAVTHPLD